MRIRFLLGHGLPRTFGTRNDIITKISGIEITSSAELVKYVQICNVGEELKLTVYRQGQLLEITVIIGEQILSQGQTSQSQSQSQNQQGYPYYPYQ